MGDEVARWDIVDVRELHPRDRVERDRVLLDHDVPQCLHARAFPSGNVPVTSVPMKLPWTTPFMLRTPMPPLPEIRLPAPASGPPTMNWPAPVEARPARDAPAPVPEGHRAGAVGADQVALHEVVDAERE